MRWSTSSASPSLLDRSAAELSLLRSQAPLGRTQLLSDPLQLDAAKYRLVVAIEALVDAAGHIIASEGLRRPVSYADAFTVLADAGFLAGETAVAAQLMARFRNVLVHGYAVALRAPSTGWLPRPARWPLRHGQRPRYGQPEGVAERCGQPGATYRLHGPATVRDVGTHVLGHVLAGRLGHTASTSRSPLLGSVRLGAGCDRPGTGLWTVPDLGCWGGAAGGGWPLGYEAEHGWQPLTEAEREALQLMTPED